MSSEPIAYTYNADYHCPRCTELQFGRSERGEIAEDAVSREGDPVGAVAPWDEWQQFSGDCETLNCGDCGDLIDDYHTLDCNCGE